MLNWRDCKPDPEHLNDQAIADSYRYVTGDIRVYWLNNLWINAIVTSSIHPSEALRLLSVNSDRAARKVSHPNFGIKRKKFSFKNKFKWVKKVANAISD